MQGAVEVLGQDGPLARALPGYEERAEQLAMTELVERALAEDAIALIEAGTGTGKTLAYLVPALLSGKKVVVSTGTKTLQEQIVHRDLPLLARHLGVPVSAAMMKGLGNYLCLRRYGEFMASPESERVTSPRSLALLREFRLTTSTGERSELKLPEDAPVWAEVQSGSETRIGQRCPHYEACFVTRMRRDAEQAQILVVNHHLFFADLALRGPHGGSAIPDYDAVIFDEAHQIESVVTEFFGVRVSTGRVEALLRDAERAFRSAQLLEVVLPLSTAVLAAASDFFASLPASREQDSGRKLLPSDALSGESRASLGRFDATLEVLLSEVRARAHASDPIAQLAKRVGRVRDDLQIIARGRETHVNWIEARGRSSSIGASPIEIGHVLRERMFERGGAAVFTSATLTTSSKSSAGRSSKQKSPPESHVERDASEPSQASAPQSSSGFAFFKERIGLDFPALELSVPSPFDYARQAALYLPKTLPDPREPSFLSAAVDQIVSLIELTQGGAFVLCTSLRNMQRLHALAAPRLSRAPLIQGMAPKRDLLETFKARNDSVLFASASFWEGVDVPGHALRLVIIDKLPFEVPTDPLVQARCERLSERGESAFMRYLVPSAALSLKQGFGRLIRTRSDRGIVAVLDRRLTSKGYGNVLLRSLPDASRCYSYAEVSAFWQG
ncbi:MAG: DinG family ATP-dependent helicase YoaA [Myxococcaceae bacterium]|nr:DinG family ATP-dependent helicase YoaA [Myxococcaceae bacterium]